MSEPDAKLPVHAEPPRFCRACDYELRGLVTPRCPECGRPFNPANPRTYLSRPLGHRRRQALRAAKLALRIVIPLLLLLPATWCWFYYGWSAEQQALRDLKLSPSGAFVNTRPIYTSWPKFNLRSAGFFMDRVNDFSLSERDKSTLTDFMPLARLTHLRELYLGHSRITDLAPLTELTELRKLGFIDTRVKDLTPLAGLAQLEMLACNETAVTDLAPLSKLTKLRQLYLRYTNVANLSPLRGLTQLRELYLRHTRVRDLAPIAGITNLEILDLSGTPVTDLTPLAGLKSLQQLDLSDTAVTNLAPLAGLMSLQQLDLHRTPVTDLTPLASCTSLRQLSLPAATITEAQADTLRRAQPDCRIDRH